MSKIILNIPHSSTSGIFGELGRWPRNYDFVNNCVNQLTDTYTDFIFSTNNENVKTFVFPLSRFVCDVERLVDDPMENIGQGIIYTHYKGYKRDELDEVVTNELINCYFNYLRSIENEIENGTILIDCHSFTQSKDDDPDICIGFNDDWSYDSSVVKIIADEFCNSGYSVRFNEPFSNSITPETEKQNYKSVMIEVNKRVYMNTNTQKLNTNPRQWMRWFGCMDRIYNKLGIFS